MFDPFEGLAFTEDDVMEMEIAESADGSMLRVTLFIRNTQVPKGPESVDPEAVEDELQAIISQTKGNGE